MAESFVQVNVPSNPGDKLKAFETTDGNADDVKAQAVVLTDGTTGEEVAPLTDDELRAAPVHVIVDEMPPIEVDVGDITISAVVDEGAAGVDPWLVAGPLTDTELRAAPVEVDGSGVTQPISAAALPLPTGAATEAKQDDQTALLTTIDADTSNLDAPLSTRATEATLATRLADATFTGRINTQGQKAMAASTPVVIASDQSAIPSSGFVKTRVDDVLAPTDTIQIALDGALSVGFTIFFSGTPGDFASLIAEVSLDNGASWIDGHVNSTIFNQPNDTQGWVRQLDTEQPFSGFSTLYGWFYLEPNVTDVRLTSISDPSVTATVSLITSGIRVELATGNQGAFFVAPPAVMQVGGRYPGIGALVALKVDSDGTISTEIADGGGASPVAPRAFDLDSGGGIEYSLGASLRRSAAGGSEELLGQTTMAKSLPVTMASDQTTIKVQGNAADGAAVSGNPILVAGQDGTNVQSLKTNTTGQLETVTEAGSSSGVLGALNAAVTLAVGSNRSFGFALSGGPLTSGTLVAEQSFDGGSTWVQTLFVNSIVTQVLTGLAASGSFINPTGAEFGSFLVDGGVTHVRIRVSAYASGSVTGRVVSDVADVAASRIGLAIGYPSLSAAGMGMQVGGTDATTFRTFKTDSGGRQVVIGGSPDGSAPLGNPVLTAGQDGTNVQSIKTDTIGRQEMVGAAADGAAVTGAPVLMGGSDGANAQSLLVDTSGRPMTVGAAASDAPVAGNPVLVAGRASAAAPADVSGDGDAVTAWYLRNGAAAAVITAAGALIGGDAANGLDVDVTRVPADPFGLNADAASATGSISAKLRSIAAVQLPAALVGGRLDGNTGAWLGSTAPTVGQKTMANSLPVALASDQSNIVVVSPTPLFVGRACTFRTPGRAGTGGQKILSLHNATGSAVTVTVKKVIVDLYQTVIKAITVAPPIIRLWKVTVLPTNGTALTKNRIGGSTTSNASVTVLGDASVDGTGSGTTLTATLPAGTFITQECAPRFITAAGYEVSDRIEWLGDTEVVLAALEGVVVYLDYTAATQNPVTDMWIAGVEWKES